MRIIGKSIRQSAFDVRSVRAAIYFSLSCTGSVLFAGLINH